MLRQGLSNVLVHPSPDGQHVGVLISERESLHHFKLCKQLYQMLEDTRMELFVLSLQGPRMDESVPVAFVGRFLGSPADAYSTRYRQVT